MNIFKNKISKKDAHEIASILMVYVFDDIVIDLENELIIASAKFQETIKPSIKGVDENSKMVIDTYGNIRIVNKDITISSNIRNLDTYANLGLQMDTSFDPNDMTMNQIMDFELLLSFFGHINKELRPNKLSFKNDDLKLFLINNCTKCSNTIIKIKNSDRLVNLRCSFNYKGKSIYNAIVNTGYDHNPRFSVSLDWESTVVNPPNFKKIDFIDYTTLESLQDQTYNLYIRNKIDYSLKVPTWDSIDSFISGLDFINPKIPIRENTTKFNLLYVYFKLLPKP